MHNYPAGHVLCVDYITYQHVGISNGYGYVYENSRDRNGPGLVSLKTFGNGKKISDLGILPNSRPVTEIIHRAELLIKNNESYSLLTNNCEHFIRHICGISIESPQVRKVMFSILGYALSSHTENRRLEYVMKGATIMSVLNPIDDKLPTKMVLGGLLGYFLSHLQE